MVENGTNEDTNGDDGGGGGGGDVDGGWRDDDSNVAWDLDKGNLPFSASRQPIVSHDQNPDTDPGLGSMGSPPLGGGHMLANWYWYPPGGRTIARIQHRHAVSCLASDFKILERPLETQIQGVLGSYRLLAGAVLFHYFSDLGPCSPLSLHDSSRHTNVESLAETRPSSYVLRGTHHSDFCSFPEAHKRMQLNNWLQTHGGTHRLVWNNYIAGGPSHKPNWRSDCFGTATFVRRGDCRPDYPVIVDGSLLGQGHGPSKADAQEDAAGMTLANLLSSHETATHS